MGNFYFLSLFYLLFQNYVFSTMYYLCNKIKLINQIIMLYTLNLYKDVSIIAQ